MPNSIQIYGAIIAILMSSVVPNLCLGDEIWVQAKTRLLAPSLPYRDGYVTVQIVDDIGSPISRVPVDIKLTPRLGNPRQTSAVADELGLASAYIDLKPDLYSVTATFNGNEFYGASSATFDLRFESCKPDARFEWPSGAVFIAPDDINATITRSHCIDRTTSFIVSAGDESKRIALQPGVTSADITLPTDGFTSGAATIEASAIESFGVEHETIESEFFVFDSAPSAHCEFNFQFEKIRVRCRLPQTFDRWLKARHTQCALTIVPLRSDASPDLTKRPDLWISDIIQSSKLTFTQQSDDAVLFSLPYTEAKQFIYSLRCPEANLSPIAQDVIAIPETNPFYRVTAFLALCLVIAISLGILHAVRRRISNLSADIPKPNSDASPVVLIDVPKPSHRSSSPRPKNCSRTSIVSCILNDSSGTADKRHADHPDVIPIADLEINGKHNAVEGDSYSFEVEQGEAIAVCHSAALPWKGRISGSGHVQIRLTTRREYVCRCFCFVASRLLHADDLSWGEIPPRRLAREFDASAMRNPKKRNQLARDLEKFCSAVSEATYGSLPISLEKIDEIYALSKRIIALHNSSL